jgi:2-keto-4-pentenoate hydratase/2-oxohepta-3-ene-1,7-dioic acid hydratase in catechol pathway
LITRKTSPLRKPVNMAKTIGILSCSGHMIEHSVTLSGRPRPVGPRRLAVTAQAFDPFRGIVAKKPIFAAVLAHETIASGVLKNVDRAALVSVGDEFTYLAPISGVRQIAATGFNYKKHIAEMSVATPSEPEVFLKSMLAMTGPFDPIQRGPNIGVKLDWETECAIVIGREVLDISAADAAD